MESGNGKQIAGNLEHDPEKLQTFRIRSCAAHMHDPEKLQTFRIRSCAAHRHDPEIPAADQ
jgi:hypothetical protein